MNLKKIINSLTDKQVRLARMIEKAGIASFSKACKAIAERDIIVKHWLDIIKKQKNN